MQPRSETTFEPDIAVIRARCICVKDPIAPCAAKGIVERLAPHGSSHDSRDGHWPPNVVNNTVASTTLACTIPASTAAGGPKPPIHPRGHMSGPPLTKCRPSTARPDGCAPPQACKSARTTADGAKCWNPALGSQHTPRLRVFCLHHSSGHIKGRP